MIVECPLCAKRYDLPSQLLDAPLKTEQGEGWFLSCAACAHVWWHSQSEVHKSFSSTSEFSPEQSLTVSPSIIEPTESIPSPSFSSQEIQPPNFQNLTDLSLLHYSNDSRKAGVGKVLPANREYFPPSVNNFSKPNSPPAFNHKPSAKRIFILTFSFITIFVSFLALLIYLLNAAGQGKIIQRFQPFSHSDVVLKIEDVRYDIQTVGDRKTILVVGRIVNPHSTNALVNPLNISIWGKCDSNSVQLKNTNGYCLVGSWSHKWDKSTLVPGESVSFETVGSISSSLHISQVDVTLP